MVSDAEQCLREVRGFFPETPNIILLGHGFGGVLSAILAKKEPELISRVVLHNPLFKVWFGLVTPAFQGIWARKSEFEFYHGEIINLIMTDSDFS